MEEMTRKIGRLGSRRQARTFLGASGEDNCGLVGSAQIALIRSLDSQH